MRLQTDWQITAAEKIKHKKDTGAPSELMIHWQHPEHGKQKIIYTIASAKSYVGSSCTKSHRRERYKLEGKSYRVGSNGAVKDLIAKDSKKQEALGIPDVVIKSLHSDANDALHLAGATASTRDRILRGYQGSAAFYTSQGIAAFCGTRERRSTRTELPFLVLQKLGDGRDLMEVLIANEGKGTIFNRTAVENIKQLGIKLLARIDFLRQLSGGQALLDIKADNLVAEFDAKHQVVDIWPIDIDSAFGQHPTTTRASLAPDDIRRLQPFFDRKEPPTGEAARDFDHKILANVLMLITSCLGHQKDVASLDFGSGALPYFYLRFSKHHPDPCALKDYYDDMRAGHLLEKHPLYREIYKKEIESCQTRIARRSSSTADTLEAKHHRVFCPTIIEPDPSMSHLAPHPPSPTPRHAGEGGATGEAPYSGKTTTP